MKKIIINNYRYWYNEITNVLYADDQYSEIVDVKFFTNQEKEQYFNAIKYL